MTLKRLFDIFFALILLVMLLVPLVLVTILIKIADYGPALYWSKRVGKDNKIFLMPKFRTMLLKTPEVATHLLTNPDQYLIRGGGLLRKSSLDEIPQLFSILKGDMSFVGPRPALYNQYDLIQMRTDVFVSKIVPGLTGLAQINGRDDLSLEEKVKWDQKYLKHQSFCLDLKILFKTFFKVLKDDSVSH